MFEVKPDLSLCTIARQAAGRMLAGYPKEDREDAVQEAALRAWHALTKFWREELWRGQPGCETEVGRNRKAKAFALRACWNRLRDVAAEINEAAAAAPVGIAEQVFGEGLQVDGGFSTVEDALTVPKVRDALLSELRVVDEPMWLAVASQFLSEASPARQAAVEMADGDPRGARPLLTTCVAQYLGVTTREVDEAVECLCAYFRLRAPEFGLL